MKNLENAAMNRRDFLRSSALATAAAPLLPGFLAESSAAATPAAVGAGAAPAGARITASGHVEYEAGNRRYRVVNGRNLTASVSAEGRLRLHYPETKPSFNGHNTCKAWVFNSFMVPLSAAEVSALTSTGLSFPEGNHTIYVYWINPQRATTVAALRAGWWDTMQNPQSFQNHTAQMEYVILEIRDLRPGRTEEIKPPPDIQGAAWYPQYQQTAHKAELPAGKIFGVTKRVCDIAPSRLAAQGLYLQAIYHDVNNGQLPYDRTWVTQRAYHKGRAELPFDGTLLAGQTVTRQQEGLNCRPDDIISIHKGYSGALPAGVQINYRIESPGVFQFVVSNTSTQTVQIRGGALYAGYFGSVNEEAEKIYSHSSRRGHVTTSEICENGIPSDAVERIYKRLYELQSERDGVRDVNSTNIVADYYAGLYGYGTDTSAYATFDEKRSLLSASEHARKPSMRDGQSQYYTHEAFKYRHRLVTGYLDGISRLLDGTRIYGHIANLEKQYIAMVDRKVLTFGWVGFEGVQCEVERAATDQRLPLLGGDLVRTSRPNTSFEQMKYEAFFSLLIGDIYTLWDDGSQYGTNVLNFGLAHIGGASDFKNQWQPAGGAMVQYDRSNTAHPQSAGGPCQWSDSAAPGHNGAFCGAYLLGSIRNFIDRSLAYARFSYTSRGTPYTGYFNGNEPVQGALGNAEVSRFGRANAGQCNIVNQEEHRRPIVLAGRGTAGSVAIILNPFAGLTETVTYSITLEKTHLIRHTGPALGIYRLGQSRLGRLNFEPHNS